MNLKGASWIHHRLGMCFSRWQYLSLQPCICGDTKAKMPTNLVTISFPIPQDKGGMRKARASSLLMYTGKPRWRSVAEWWGLPRTQLAPLSLWNVRRRLDPPLPYCLFRRHTLSSLPHLPTFSVSPASSDLHHPPLLLYLPFRAATSLFSSSPLFSSPLLSFPFLPFPLYSTLDTYPPA
jgi:hypothetical protein